MTDLLKSVLERAPDWKTVWDKTHEDWEIVVRQSFTEPTCAIAYIESDSGTRTRRYIADTMEEAAHKAMTGFIEMLAGLEAQKKEPSGRPKRNKAG